MCAKFPKHFTDSGDTDLHSLTGRDEITLPASGDKREHLAADLWSFGDEDSVCSVYTTAILLCKGIAYGYCFNRSLKTMVVTETEMNVGRGRPSSEYSVMKCS